MTTASPLEFVEILGGPPGGKTCADIKCVGKVVVSFGALIEILSVPRFPLVSCATTKIEFKPGTKSVTPLQSDLRFDFLPVRIPVVSFIISMVT